jgi:hypothetical protein
MQECDGNHGTFIKCGDIKTNILNIWQKKISDELDQEM